MTEGKGVCAVRHFRRASRDEGAAAVEFALLFPIFMILALGILNGGIAFNKQINVTQSAREASRYGATLAVTNITSSLCNGDPVATLANRESCWLKAVDTAVTTSAGGQTNPIAGYNYRCVALLVRDSAGAIDTSRTASMENRGSAVTGSTTVCNNSINSLPNLGANSTVVITVLSSDVRFFVLFINPQLHLDGVSTTPYEATIS